LFVRRLGPDGETLPNTTFMVEDGRIYQVVAVVVNSPLPVAWVVMGFELDRKAALELRDITGLGVTLSAGSAAGSRTIVSTAPSGQLPDSTLETRRIVLAETAGATIVATLSKSLAEAMTAFDRLTNFLYWIAALSLGVSAYAAFWLARNITRSSIESAPAAMTCRSPSSARTNSARSPKACGSCKPPCNRGTPRSGGSHTKTPSRGS
jgi:hypothetical protein